VQAKPWQDIIIEASSELERTGQWPDEN